MAKVKLDNMINTQEEQFPTNSIASREILTRPEPAVTILETPPDRLNASKVVNRPKAVRRRKSITRTIKQTMFSEDTKNVVEHVIFQVLVPAAKSMISDMFTQAIEMLLFGEGGSGRNRSSRDRGEKSMVSYGSMYKRDDRERRPISRRDRFGLDDIYFTGPRAGSEASDVLASMCDRLEEYDQVTVADYFDLANMDGADWTYAKWGWTSLKKAYCTHTTQGYKIVLPEPKELD